MTTVYLGLGSNLGDRSGNLNSALTELSKKGVRVLRVSEFIETDPVGGPPQGKYLNGVLKGETDLVPEELLAAIKDIERRLGRKKERIRNAPRPIDIDILFYGERNIQTADLQIPHPRLFERDFVLDPLKEIAPEMLEEFSYENRPQH